jgi:hypothetical protein
MFRQYISALFLVCIFIGKSQTDSLKHKPIRLASLSVGFEPGLTEGKRLSQDAFLKMAPGNYIVTDQSGKISETQSGMGEFMGWNIASNWQFWNPRKKKFNDQIQLNLEVSCITNHVTRASYYKQIHRRFDTLISDETPTVYYIDTVKKYTYNYSYTRSKFFLSLSNTFHTKQSRIVSLYAGYSIGYGITFQNSVKADLEYKEDFMDQVGFYLNTIYPTSPHSYMNYSQTTKVKEGTVYVFSVPIGIVLRTGADGIAKKLSFIIGIRSGLTIEQVPEVGDFSTGFINLHGSVKYFL